ncbi:nitrite reductase (NADH) small subunit [Rheinheimera pacifica]|uniref:nitrite reductase small subunit NirD n=1 Tax=Rheinheimera pacifica TaxID=173990 RepID=UPI000CC05B85|nr:nitrite reductase small subunit NirD [Rheinheimera pacifica]MDR6985396.1 nitrite reductase (NADH) small subunit [Rheinheimera pacifica]PKM18196.1 MAG: nitrite reductase (NAD(P)H) small subunit [Gammaproteobacteria bacterium HGW-Gammaproteobacteria-15]
MAWTDICAYEDLVENSGICALLNGRQVAVFLLELQGEPQIYAIGNYDPLGKANVLSRGIVGSVGEQIVVASPLYKQHFSLTTGQCLEQPDVVIPVYSVKLQQGRVWLNAGQQNQQASAA